MAWNSQCLNDRAPSPEPRGKNGDAHVLATNSPTYQQQSGLTGRTLKEILGDTYCIGPELSESRDWERELTSKALLELGLAATAV